MASGVSDSHPGEAAGTGPAQELLVNLKIVSPSVCVNGPLLFPDLPAVTTIKQLKDRIRQALPLRPADENQRLIHRGRALLRESDNLLDVFGASALQTAERQTIHLVVRENTDSHSSSPAPGTARGPSPASTAHAPAPMVQQHTAQIYFGPQPPPGFARRPHSQPAASGGHGARTPSPASAQQTHANVDPAAVLQQHHQNMNIWLNQVQRDAAATRAIVQQHQLGRAHMGMRGIGDSAGPPNHAGANAGGGLVSPAPTQTIYRETVGPNGHSHHIETVIRTGTPGQPHALSLNDVQNILRGADAIQATAAITDTMQRSASGASLHGRPLNHPGVTTPMLGPRASRPGSGRATPDLGARSGLGADYSPVAAGIGGNPSCAWDVYVVSSPEGPRGLVMRSHTAAMYYTPSRGFQNSMHPFRTVAGYSGLVYPAAQHQTPQSNYYQQHPPQQQQQQQQHQQGAQQQHHPANAEVLNGQAPAPEAAQGAIHPANPPAAGVPPLLMQAWPHVWLIFRLAVFVWLFTSPNSSWSRWFTVICLAILVFLLSTGILNGVAENAWRPIGRHLENILPTPEHHARRRQLPAGHAGPPEQQPLVQARETTPAQMAARLTTERTRRTWFATQLRRAERAGLLFLASIAPGVAERHIANLEAETRAEEARRRQEEEEEAAAATEAENNASPGDVAQTNNEAGAADGRTQEGTAHGNERQEEARGDVGAHVVGEDLIAL
ncbi:Ubiquitin family protein [Metarhizium album ARSEF 1941]|uniref:Ubiquitin family protein n=1 Tax=Metarhizium album (strain ARSEF 1941) TaxID=1081103 RepID=A0A0B2WXE1_METAS|nr:Ubiquitin family protein [Metarhizium album ARSEF 1941]KHO00937.1 Ubiquitin family protein [Metarhizium album ARSEF 1941]